MPAGLVTSCRAMQFLGYQQTCRREDLLGSQKSGISVRKTHLLIVRVALRATSNHGFSRTDLHFFFRSDLMMWITAALA